MKTIEKQRYDRERALYGLTGAVVRDCIFAGPADGESPLKECSQIEVENCEFALRYPFWHVTDGMIRNTSLTESCRAALWYDHNVTMESCSLKGVKAFRECQGVVLKDCEIDSEEFAWKCGDLTIDHVTLTSVYPFLELKNSHLDRLEMTGKYSFQYTENVVVRNSLLKTKDAFWHSKNVTVEDSVISGEYLGWYSENLKLVRCRLVGTQPLCYCKGLVLEDCTMDNTDLAFEKSDVTATVLSPILSVKNPISGSIRAEAIGELILDDEAAKRGGCRIRTTK